MRRDGGICLMKRRRCKQCGKLFMPVGKEVIC
nr:MAG TPA: hypothetical protein [Caudoviricetes sp.]